MKTITFIACALAAFATMGSPAVAQGTATPAATTPATQAPPPKTAPPAKQAPPASEQSEKARLEAEAAQKALADKQNAEKAARDMEKAQRALEQAKRQIERQAQHDVQREVDRVQDALKEAQRELELYAKGTAALDTSRYEKALQAFAEAAALKGEKADSALYWKAFAEYKVQALQAALESLKEMQKKFPDSRWLEQALALELEVKASMGRPVSPAATPDEELKLLALNSLLNTDAEQALPMLEKMIASQQSARLKRRALFVVSQSKSPRARAILTSVAKGSAGPDLQVEALRYLQMFGGTEDKIVLLDVYASSKDRDVKILVVDTLAGQGDARTLVEMARKETDQEMRKRIVERLSRMKAKEATDYMFEIINK